MVKIVIAGGSSEVGQEVIDALVATGKHEIISLWRKEPDVITNGVNTVVVDYGNKDQLEDILQGAHTVLSFVGGPNVDVQKNIIDACIAAGVKRFAPSEWATSDITTVPWYAGKGVIREYLQEVNKDKKVLEYTLFQPGGFLNYLASPQKTTKHLTPIGLHIDFQNARALVIDGHLDDPLTFTAVQDLGAAVARAVEFEGEWPVVGGISGNQISIREVLQLGEKILGNPFEVEHIPVAALEAGVPGTSWLPGLDHPSLRSVPEEQKAAVANQFWSAYLLSTTKGAWTVSDEWNRLLPDLQFIGAEEFLTQWWGGKRGD
ncbi:NAD(P)-binding protein [Podospora aff. communis PSN243]|uniref:NAD(P)-binding protein n=1 Tax=Podospora aff. communis PSN243 TaxID=3040156 RepID=A0AAV9G2H5_9PEZI|nr:NAD(P)-binding protein [Podospora aff. communis PSN243]